MARRAPTDIGGINHALVIRVNGGLIGLGGRGRGANRQPVFVVPLTVLQAYALQNLSAADQKQLDAFFAAHTQPKVDAAVANSLIIRDGIN